MVSTNEKGGSNNWYLDSAATNHITNNKDLLTNYQKIVPTTIWIGDDSGVIAYGKGTARVTLSNGQEICFVNVLHCKAFGGRNLLSVPQITTYNPGIIIKFGSRIARILRGKNAIATGTLVGRLYCLNTKMTLQIPKGLPTALVTVVTKNLDLWHEQFGHINYNTLKEMSSVVKGMNVTKTKSPAICEACMMGKSHRQISHTAAERTKELLALVHSDVLGPVQTQSHQGKQYYISFIDDYSQYRFIYFLRHKSEVFETFKQWQTLVENQLGKRIQAFRSDGGGEFTLVKF